MQIKKIEVRNAILEKGREEFLQKGFKHSSLRKIVKKAGTTIGNFYNYFENKEALFEALVKEEFEKLKFFIKNHNEVERPDYLWQTSNVNQWRSVLKEVIINTYPQFTDSFVLLVEGSKGTKFENTRDKIINLIKDHFIEHMERFDMNIVNKDFAEIIAEQMLDGIVLIIKKHSTQKKRRELLIEHLLFYSIGTMGLLKK